MANAALKFSVLLALTVSFFSSSDAVGAPGVTGFCYSTDDPNCGETSDKWSGQCKTGQQQSPINITFTADEIINAVEMKFSLHQSFHEDTSHDFYAQNNGHSLQFEFVSNTTELKSSYAMSVEWLNLKLNAEYTFAQLHFHWGQTDDTGSEHSVFGYRYPLELHMVYYRSNYTCLADALAYADREAVMVMAVFYTEGEHNDGLNSIVDVAEKLRLPSDVTHFTEPLNLKALYPTQNNELIRRPFVAIYDGSLTTPTCDEKVKWVVFLEPSHLSNRQMTALRHVENEDDIAATNYRETQDLNERTISFYRADMSEAYVSPSQRW